MASIVSPWKRAGSFIWTNLNPLYPRMIYAEFGWIMPSGSGEEGFLSMYFGNFVIISPWKKAWPFIWTNLNPLHQRMLCAKIGLNLSSGSGEEDKNVKSLRQQRRRRQQRRTMDKFWSEKLSWALGSGELKTTHRPPHKNMFYKLTVQIIHQH